MNDAGLRESESAQKIGTERSSARRARSYSAKASMFALELPHREYKARAVIFEITIRDQWQPAWPVKELGLNPNYRRVPR
jgi:hypothetical protein